MILISSIQDFSQGRRDNGGRAGSHRIYSLYLFSPVKCHLPRKDLIDHVMYKSIPAPSTNLSPFP